MYVLKSKEEVKAFSTYREAKKQARSLKLRNFKIVTVRS